MAKKIYYINVQIEAYIDVHDRDKKMQLAIKENINHIPSLEFAFESDAGNYLKVDCCNECAGGKITTAEVGKLIKFNFEGWFKIDCSKRRDKAESWLEPSLKKGLSLLYKEISIYTDINTFAFTPIDVKGKDIDSIKVKSLITISKPDGVDL
jgi:hypothetical protein